MLMNMADLLAVANELWEISIYPPFSSPAEQILNQTGNCFLLFDENASHRLQIYFMLNSIE